LQFLKGAKDKSYWKPRYCKIKSKGKGASSVMKHYHCKNGAKKSRLGKFILSGTHLVSYAGTAHGQPFVFSVTSPVYGARTFMFAAESEEARQEWLQAFSNHSGSAIQFQESS